jgi:radical SAM superfamily enzyme YgiQ (UPF0313 family)
MLELANKIIRGVGKATEINGIAYRNGTGVRVNLPRPFIRSLDVLPFPSRDLIDLMEYKLPGAIITSRGCPHKCIFCAAGALAGGAYRVRSSESVISEVLHLYNEYGIRELYIVDDTFTARPFTGRVLKFCRYLKALKLGIKWFCESRADVASKDLLSTMADAGCTDIQFGCESGDDEVLRLIRKGVTVSQIENAVRTARDVGIIPTCSFMLGHAFDTIESMHRTVDFAKHLQEEYHAWIAIAVNTPYPGTFQYENADKIGLTITTRHWADHLLSDPIIRTKNFDQDGIKQVQFDALQKLGIFERTRPMPSTESHLGTRNE